MDAVTDAAIATGDRSAVGPYTDLAALIGLRQAAARLTITPSRRTAGRLAGPYTSRLRGRGVDFEEVRPYQPGDDVRLIDWRVTARTTITHTRVYTEERERPVAILCDQRHTMFFGSTRRYKSVQAANLAALLGWTACTRGDRAGGLVVGNDSHREFRPQRRQSGLLRFLAALDHFNHRLDRDRRHADISLTDALTELCRTARPGTAVFVISDFHDLDPACLDQLLHLSRRASVTALAVDDPLERELPAAGDCTVSDGERRIGLDTTSARLRQTYRQAAAREHGQLQESLGRLGIPLLSVSTADDPLAALRPWFGAGAKGKHRHVHRR